jgi:hypothetical protein
MSSELELIQMESIGNDVTESYNVKLCSSCISPQEVPRSPLTKVSLGSISRSIRLFILDMYLD